jgi:hypothetical protein
MNHSHAYMFTHKGQLPSGQLSCPMAAPDCLRAALIWCCCLIAVYVPYTLNCIPCTRLFASCTNVVLMPGACLCMQGGSSEAGTGIAQYAQENAIDVGTSHGR